MAGWYTYHGTAHYSRHVCRGGVVRRVHLGSGPVAVLAATLDARRREERREQDEAWRARAARPAAAEEPLVGFEGQVEDLARRTLESAGYRRHNRSEWRRTRVADETRAGGPSAEDLRRCGEMGQAAEAAWLDLAGGGDDGVREALGRKLAALKADLGGPAPTPLERLLVERVALTWLAAGYSAAAVAGAPGRGLSPAQLGQLQGRQERAQRGFLAATKALATVKKLIPAGARVGPVEEPTRLPRG